MAARDFASLVCLRAGTILLVLATAHSFSPAQMDLAGDRDRCARRDCIPHRLRFLRCSYHRTLGLAVWKSRFARGGRSARLVWNAVETKSRRLVYCLDWFVDVDDRRRFTR